MSDMSNGQPGCPLSVVADEAGLHAPTPRAGRLRHEVRNAARPAVRSGALIPQDAESRFDISQSDLLVWSAALACDRHLTGKQNSRLHHYIDKMCPRAARWTRTHASALLDEMRPAAPATAGIPTAFSHTPLTLQRWQLAQVQLYLSGALVRQLGLDQWRSRIRQHHELASIAERITAIQVDCAWEAMDANLHYEMLCSHLQMLEQGERDPVQRQMLSCDRRLLMQCLQRLDNRAGDAGAARRRLILKIILTGLLDARLFSGEARWRMDLVQRLYEAGACSRRAMNMNDMALIAFLRQADDGQLSRRARVMK